MKNFALIGKSLAHSFSKDFFAKYFEEHNVNASYQNLELKEIGEIQQILKDKKFDGFNVTIPYKEAIIPFLDDLSGEAKQIGAVNCIVKTENGYIGHNTDAYGFMQNIKPFLTNLQTKAMILGTGGASKAINFGLNNLGIETIFISRSAKAANIFTYEEINFNMIDACKIIINTTPVGTFPNVNDFLPVPFQHLTNQHLVIDLIYNPIKTKFLEQSENSGAQILNGASMLKHQALKSYEIWKNQF